MLSILAVVLERQFYICNATELTCAFGDDMLYLLSRLYLYHAMS